MTTILILCILGGSVLYLACSITIISTIRKADYPKLGILHPTFLTIWAFCSLLTILGAFLMFLENYDKKEKEKNPPVYEQVTEPLYRLKTP